MHVNCGDYVCLHQNVTCVWLQVLSFPTFEIILQIVYQAFMSENTTPYKSAHWKETWFKYSDKTCWAMHSAKINVEATKMLRYSALIFSSTYSGILRCSATFWSFHFNRKIETAFVWIVTVIKWTSNYRRCSVHGHGPEDGSVWHNFKLVMYCPFERYTTSTTDLSWDTDSQIRSPETWFNRKDSWKTSRSRTFSVHFLSSELSIHQSSYWSCILFLIAFNYFLNRWCFKRPLQRRW